ncbi:hypothetical protein ACFDTO_21165 [Microbacteriaceae bacterium 4G12]
MSWNIGVIAVYADENEIDDVIPDVFELGQTDVYFEDVSSVSMGNSIGVGYANNWIIIIDPLSRFFTNDTYPQELAKKGFKVKSFYISEDLIFRNYHTTFLGKVKVDEYLGISSGIKYLKNHKITPWDEWGETLITQILELEIFNNKTVHNFSLMDIKYRKYDID